MAEQNECYHCGLPNDPKLVFETTILGERRRLCCVGCLAVSEAIVANGLESYYQYRTEKAEQAESPTNDILSQLAVYDEPALQEEFVFDEGNHKHIQLTIEGITCSACAWLIEKQLTKLAGIKQVAVNVSERRAAISWYPEQISLSNVLLQIRKIGYRAFPFESDSHERSYVSEHKSYLKKLGLAGLLSMQVMMLMTGLYFDLFGNIEAQTKQYFHWVALVLSTPVVFYSGSLFTISAIKALSARTVNMDVPIALAVLATYIAGVRSVLQQQGEVYFESICMFVFLLLLSRYLEHQARYKASKVSSNLMQHIPVTATLVDQNEKISNKLAKLLEVGDCLLVKAGEVIPVDGEVIEGESRVDESMITGEFVAVKKQVNNKVYGGTVNQHGVIKVRVVSTLKNALVSQIIRLQTTALLNKPRIALFADRLSRYFIMAVLAIAGLTYIGWSYAGNDNAFWITIAVLVATCPCALGLATPTAFTCAMAELNRRGILIKRADALEQITTVNLLAFDKTGTITEGKFSIDNAWYGESLLPKQCLSIIRQIERFSEHPIANAFFSEPDEVSGELQDQMAQNIKNVNVAQGQGIGAEVNGKRLFVGSISWFEELTGQLFGEHYSQIDFSPNVLLFNEHEILAAFFVTDTLKSDSVHTVQQLKLFPFLELALLSGDVDAHVKNVAKQLGIPHAIGGVKPQGKLHVVEQWQHSNKKVMMIGDGINDAPVLSQADVSVAVGNASDVAKSSADIVLLREGLQLVPNLFHFSRQVQKTVKQNVAWALGYNLLILPFAVLGFLHPWMAVIGMSLSSLIVTVNSIRLRGVKAQ
jgi:Cu2+-exporting ATPase